MSKEAKKKALFITIEGGEGAGKTTLLQKLKMWLVEQGHKVLLTREPGGSSLGESIRQLLLKKNEHLRIGSQAELFLFLAARAQHLEELIKPALQQGTMVLCDRFSDSTIVYQGIGRKLGLEKVRHLCAIVTKDTVPDLTLFLDVQPETGLKRTQALHKEESVQGEMDRIESEKLSFHYQVREGFLFLAHTDQERVKIIDANQSPDIVFQQALTFLTLKMHV